MKRILLMVIRLFYIAPVWFYKICKYGKDPNCSVETRYRLLHTIMPKITRAGRVRIHCEGLSNIPKENGYVLFPNHQGLFDSLLFFQTHEKPFSIVIKKEMEHVFLVKQVVRLIDGLYMDRKDLRQSMKLIQKMTKDVENGRNYIIFAEGTRSKNGNHVLPFKGGSFRSATRAKCPIVPVAIVNSFTAFDTHSIAPVDLYIHYLPAIPYEEYKEMKDAQIAKMVQDRIQTAMDHIVKIHHVAS